MHVANPTVYRVPCQQKLHWMRQIHLRQLLVRHIYIPLHIGKKEMIDATKTDSEKRIPAN